MVVMGELMMTRTLVWAYSGRVGLRIMRAAGGGVDCMVRMVEERYLEVLISYDSCETGQGDVSSKHVVCHEVCDVHCLMTISEQDYSLVLGFLFAVFIN
jgi:hypothetical protein